MPALQQFFDAERKQRGWSMRQTAERSKISLSKAYAIVNGDDNVEFETFENIAAAFSMSPAELAVAIGKGTASDDPRRIPIHAALRAVPDEQLDTVELMIRGLTSSPMGATNRRRDGASTQRPGGRRALERHPRLGEDSGAQGGEPTVYRGVRAAFAHITPAHVLSYLQRLVPATNRLSAQPAG